MARNYNRTFIIKLLLIQILCGVLSLCLGLNLGISSDISRYKNKLYENIVIEGIAVDHLTPSEARKIVKTQYVDKILSTKITLTLDKKIFTASLKDFFVQSNVDKIVEEAYDYPAHLNKWQKWLFLNSNTQKNFAVTLHFNEQAVNTLTESIIRSANKKASNGTISISRDKIITIKPHADGYLIDKEKLSNQIHAALNTHQPSTINILDSAVKQSPVHTTQFLNSIDTCVSSFSTTFAEHTGRAKNIELGAKAINGTVLAPGEIFSFNDTVGETTLEKGYAYAGILVNSKAAQGVGGGICQVSSTLYDAVLKTGLYSLKRRPHSIPINYVPLGLDATISWGSIDFAFQNTLNYPIYIQAYVERDKLYVNIYSNHTLKKKHYEIVSEVYTPRKQYYTTALSVGSKNALGSGSRSSQVKVTRKIYENNILKGSEIISFDTY